MTRSQISARHTAARASIGRDPRDVSALLGYLAVVAIGIVAARGADRTTAGIEADLVELVGHVPAVVLGFAVLTVAILHLLFFAGIPLFLLCTRRWRRWAIFTLGWVVTSLLVWWLGRALGVGDTADARGRQGEELLRAWPPAQSVGTAACAVVLLSPHLSRRWRRFGWGFVGALSLTRLITTSDALPDVLLSIGVGGTVGSLLLLGFGRRVALPTFAGVLAALDRIGVHAVSVTAAEAPGDSLAFTAELADGRRAHCKVVTSEQHEADRLLRRYRRLRVRELGEDAAFSTVRRAAAVEAMLAMAAADAGVRTPRVQGVAPLPVGDAMVIAFEDVAGVTLDRVDPERITDDVLAQAWTALAALRGAGIAHRDLQLSSWLLDAGGQLWLIDFSFGEPAATDGALSADIAELLSATYAVVGAERAVAAAERTLGGPILATGLSHLVPIALTRPTRAAVKATPDGLAPLVDATAAACGVHEPEFAPIERIKPRSLLMAAMLVFAVYVLLPQLMDLPRLVEAIRDADPRFMVLAAAASLLTYVGSGMAINGSCPSPVRWMHSTLAAVSATFVGAIAPPGVAGLGLNARFLAKQGVPGPVAISATAVKELAVMVVHVLLLALLAIVAGSTGVLSEELDRLPSIRTVGIVVAVALALLVVVVATPRVRATVRDSILPAVRASVSSLRELAADPAKVLMLLVGALVLQGGYIAALYFAGRALGGEVGFVTVGLLYLTVGSVASVAPTPGGVGAIEAVLLAALTGVGMAAAPALAAVFLYRLVTFWLPIPFGGLAFRHLVARDLL